MNESATEQQAASESATVVSTAGVSTAGQSTMGGPAATASATGSDGRHRHVIIVGFGVAGRAAVNNVIEQNISYTVVET
ncbi:MAG: hypothetical protein ABIP55_13525, partial [Tepidisphaeraceae bacterium]